MVPGYNQGEYHRDGLDGMSPKRLRDVICVCERRKSHSFARRATQCQEVARRLGRAASTIVTGVAAQCCHSKRRFGVTAPPTAQWHAERAARRPKPGKLAGSMRRCEPMWRGTIGWHRRHSERGSCARPGRVLERPSAWTAEGSAVGKRLEPRADRPPTPGRLPDG